MRALAEIDLNVELEEKLRFERLVADLSSHFISVPADGVDRLIEDAQSRICHFLDLDHSTLWQASAEDPEIFVLTHFYRSPDLPLPPPRMKGNEVFPWAVSKLLRGEIVCVPRTEDAPTEAALDRQAWIYYGVKSTLGFPLSAGGGGVFGVLSFDATRRERDFPELLQQRLQVIAEVFANALARKHAEQTLRESEARLSLAAASANAGLWTLEPSTGRIWSSEKNFELLGLEPNDNFAFQHFLNAVHADDRELIRQRIQEAMKLDKEDSVEYRVLLKDGGVRWLSARGRRHPGLSDGPDRLMGVNIDITESRLLAQKLEALKERLVAESEYLREEIKVAGQFDEIVGHSKVLKEVFQLIEQVAPTDASVLITGETGTGKELVARAIHKLSQRNARVMVKVDCASLPSSLVESELFGREKGAFTGALSKQIGRFELADESTLFLDEIGELPLELQAKLLRILQDGEFERLGSPKTYKVNVRVIAATNRDLAECVRKGSFREDLFYRLNVFSIHVPPLRERVEDIPLLAKSFAHEFENKMGKRPGMISEDSVQRLKSYFWPGNIREMKNIVEQAVILRKGSELHFHLLETTGARPLATLEEMEYQHIVAVLEQTGWRIKGPLGAAKILGMNPSTLFSKMRRLGIPSKTEKV